MSELEGLRGAIKPDIHVDTLSVVWPVSLSRLAAVKDTRPKGGGILAMGLWTPVARGEVKATAVTSGQMSLMARWLQSEQSLRSFGEL